ncbi:MAG: DEAD/DEAH box helicase family protein [Gammaproteobacteria bacterium]|nr:DEAD/DEAH box helicase family protein [Gammaproteobacteria bacterium]
MDEQIGLDLDGNPTAGEILDRIRTESRDESEKGRWFEQLFARIALQQPEFEIDGIWRWVDWPEREELTGLDGRDIGIDLVARRTSGEWVAIQCKCHDERGTLGKGHIDKFFGGSQQPVFGLRWIVATCRWGPIAERAIRNAYPQITQVDFRQYLHVQLEERDAERPVQEPWPLQADAIEDAVEGLTNHERGRLVMACGTGKTFTALRIAEQVVAEGQRILFAAPTIALVSQARREWLRQTTRKLRCIVVCSDPTAGGRQENEDIRISELECPVSTDPSVIAQSLRSDGPTRVVFCTYHSLRRVTEAQAGHGAPRFDLAIADEAHRTTGALRGRSIAGRVNFQEFHDGQRLLAEKRLYMTATPRIYTARSKSRLASKGIKVVDMGDQQVYGPQFHLLPFAKAVEHRILSDYRVIVLGVGRASVTPALRRRLEVLSPATSPKNAPTTNDMTRVLGVSLAVNGVTEGTAIEQPGQLPRTLAFANSIERSKWYAKALMESEVLRATTRRISDGRAMKVVARHLDASASALQRNQELRALASADREGYCRIVCNVKLFTEGVDVPSLDAVAFLDPRDSQVDVVQAVGRVMRKAPGKRFGYIIIPVIIEPGRDVVAALERGTEGYRTVGRVLRALQAHDGRLAETPARFIRVYEPTQPALLGQGVATEDGAGSDPREGGIQSQLDLEEAEQGIYAHVAAASGLGKPGQLVADEIADAVRCASRVFQDGELEEPLAEALELVPEQDGGAKGVCTIAALMLANACLLQRRLRDEPQMKTILRLDKVAGASNPGEVLEFAWEAILDKDYEPVFRPALDVLRVLPHDQATGNAIRVVAECANRVADSLSELGYDHAGPLYHRILGSAKSDGAFYTNNLSAVLLARLSFTSDLIDWSDSSAVENLRIIDPACGTGTLLMASLQTIKARVADRQGEMAEGQLNALHKRIVEDMLCGLDINQHGVQLAACNMTLGAPTVDYERMNLVTMAHGPQGDGSPKAGSLEILAAADDARDLSTVTHGAPERSLETLDAEQVNESEEIRFPLRDLDGVIMNAPFTDNRKRGRKFSRAALKAMQRHEIEIRNRLHERDPDAAAVITTNSVSTFFTPLAERLLRSDRAFLAKVLPVTACTGASGVAERRFLAERFHIERIVTTHDPKRIAFSENTSIHESLLICRRRAREDRPPTEFVSLRKMPSSAEEAIEVADAISAGTVGDWGRVCRWPADRVQAGDWTPAQWYDETLAATIRGIEESPRLEPVGLRHAVGPAGRRIRDTYRQCEPDEPDAVRLFWSISTALRRKMHAEPEDWRCPKSGKEELANRYWLQRSHVLVAQRFDTISGLLTALRTPFPSVGSGWIPVSVEDGHRAKALTVWWNSTPARLMLLNQRAKKLTYASWSLAQLREILIPTLANPAWDALEKAWGQVHDLDLFPMRYAGECPARRVIDAAAAVALGVGETEVADYRRRLAVEPTITNARAPRLGEDREK